MCVWERERERKMLRKRIAEKYINLESNPDLIKTLFYCPKINYCSRHRFVAKQRSEKFHYQYKLKENNYWSVVRSSILNYYAYSYMSALLMRFEKSPLFQISAFYLVWKTQQHWRVPSMTVTNFFYLIFEWDNILYREGWKFVHIHHDINITMFRQLHRNCWR